MPNTRDVIDAFRAAAVAKGDFAEPGRDQELSARMRTAFHAIQAMGEAAFRYPKASYHGLLSVAWLDSSAYCLGLRSGRQ